MVRGSRHQYWRLGPNGMGLGLLHFLHCQTVPCRELAPLDNSVQVLSAEQKAVKVVGPLCFFPSK